MAELKSLQDFYDPRMAIAAMNAGVQQQQLGLQQEQAENQNTNMKIDNLRQALSVSSPIEGYPLYKQMLELQGQKAPTIDEYLKHDARASAQRGNRILAKEALGPIGDNEDVASSVGASHPLQGKIGDVLAQTPLERMKTQEHQNLVDNVTAQANALLPVSGAAKLGLERTAPLMAKLIPIQQEYEKNVKSLGMTKAAGIRRDKMLADQELEQFNLRSQQSIEGLTQQVQQIEEGQNQLQTRAQLLAGGHQPLQPGDNLHDMAGRIDASVKHLGLARAQLAFAKEKSPANYEALKAAAADIDAHLASLNEKKNSSQDRLSISRDAQQETARKNRVSEAYTNAVAEGQTRFGALQPAQQTNASAARIAREVEKSTGVKVKPEDILIKDPNRPGVQVNLTEEKKESQTVGEGFGKQYLQSQDSGRAAAMKLNKLDRMESLLSGVTTGKLTPAMTDIQAIGESFGVKVDGSLPAKQALQALSNEMALELRNPSGGAGMPGAMSDADREFLRSMTPGLATTNEGNQLIIETARKVAQRDQDIAKLARTYRQKNGHLDEGFYDQVQEYGQAHPLFKGQTVPSNSAAPTATKMAPFSPEEEQLYQEWKKSPK